MSLFRRAAKRDGNENPIRAQLAQCGWLTQCLSIPDWPDLICVKGGRMWLLEIKNPQARGKVTNGQKVAHELLAQFGIRVIVARTAEEFLAAVGDVDV